jgi:S-DNA-T family DNA segregation ATPase FtsK/SpoIIIE
MTDYDDAETVPVIEAAPGPPVDPPKRRTTFHDLVSRNRDRRPLVPASLRTRQGRRQVLTWALAKATYDSLYHLLHLPKYLLLAAYWTPRGLFLAFARPMRWASAEEGNWALRQQAANRGDAHEWVMLDKHRQKQSRWRWPLLTAGALVLVVAAGVVSALHIVPAWGWRAAGVLALLILARIGRPPDRPILDRVQVGQPYRKLTAEMVRAALLATGYGKEPSDFTFPREIRRDGAGYSALVDLCHGVTAAMILDRRDRIAARLRLPLDQVWLRPGRHAGQIELWVADQPVSLTRQQPWPLLKTGRADIFAPLQLGTDERGAPIKALLMFTNLIVGAIPRMGKTFVLRLALLAASLDPRTELWAADLKGTGDLSTLQPVCRHYFVGDEDDELDGLLAALRALVVEMRRRAKVIRELPREVCPESKVTPELAGKKSLGLHPIVVGIDECQVMFTDERRGKEFEKLCTDVIKRGPALGIILILATQKPDAQSLPTGISANAGMRLCLRVMGQQENDMVLGTSMYRNGIRATQFTAADKGMGWLVGAADEPVVIRTHYVDAPMAEKVVARALELRGGAEAKPEAPRVRIRNLAADVKRIWPADTPALWLADILERLQQLDAEVYVDMTTESLSAALRAAGVVPVPVHRKLEGKGYTRHGVRLEDLTAALSDSAATAIDSAAASAPGQRKPRIAR